MSGIRVVVEVSSADRPESLGGSRVTVFADNYDDALKALLLYRAGKILSTQILKTGIRSEEHTSELQSH